MIELQGASKASDLKFNHPDPVGNYHFKLLILNSFIINSFHIPHLIEIQEASKASDLKFNHPDSSGIHFTFFIA